MEVKVIKHFSKYDEEPTDEDLPTEEQGKERKWERVIKSGQMIIKWPESGGAGKGNWGKQ